MVKEYWDNDKFNRPQRDKKPKGHALRRFIKLFLALCCCLMVMILAIGFLANDFPFAIDQPLTKDQSPTIDQPPNAHLPTNAVINTDSKTGLTANAKSNADDTAWCLILVNKRNLILDDYEVELKELTNGQSVDKRIYPALQEMFDTARSNGVYPVVVAGYRTVEKQQSLMDAKIADYKAEGYSAKEAKIKAEAWVAIPGTSEHQLGISVDIGADNIHSTDKEVEEWLKQNSYKFGFIYRYAADKSEITGVIDEPWHYRYVGVKAATEIYNQGICLEEYLNRTN